MTYSGNNRIKNTYFRQFPKLSYPYLGNDRRSIYDYTQVRNIFRRSVIREDVLESFILFDQYNVEGDDRPDNVAEFVYGTPDLDWVILITNNITNVRDQWPMSNADLSNYLSEKYTNEQLAQIHHYETKKVLDSQNRLIQPEGVFVDSDYTVTYIDDGVEKTVSSITSVSYQQHEIDLNDAKREIDILKPEYLELVFRDNKENMKYETSSQYINDKLKKTENPRIIAPR